MTEITTQRQALFMVKFVVCLVCTLILAGVTMQLRQQSRDLAYQNNQLHAQIKAQQARLWNHQLRIAAYTAPPAITETVGQHDLDLVPIRPTSAEYHRR